MCPTTMELPETIEDEAGEGETVATAGPMVPESALDEVGRELGAGLEVDGVFDPEFEVKDRAAAGDAIDSTTVADTSADPTKPAKKTAAEKAADKATKHYHDRKRQAEENLSNCVLHRRDCEAALKSAKGSEKAAAELLEAVLSRGVEQLPLFDRPAATASDTPATDPNAVGLSPDPTAAAQPLKVHDPDAWKARPITDLGLHPSLAEKLASDGMDTIGRLEQRRADIANGKEKWPKGIGPAKVTQIEDAVIGWLTENQHQVSGQDEPSETEIEATPEMLAKLLVDRAKALNTGDPDCLEPAGDTDNCWDSGVQAFDRGDKLTDCPLTSGVEQDDWLRGWMTAQENHSGETISSDLGDV